MQTLSEFLVEALEGPTRDHAFGDRLGRAEWTWTSSTRMLERARAIAAALEQAGIGIGNRVALIANNCVDWLAADFGTFFAGCVVVPIFATLATDQIEYIFRDSSAKFCFIESEADAARLRAACPSAPRMITFDGSGPDSLATFERLGSSAQAAGGSRLGASLGAIRPDDLAVLIYTSGTTGNPKGVMLNHRNLVSNANACTATMPVKLRSPGAPVLSVLPFAHIYEHTLINVYTKMKADLQITQPDFLLGDLKSARPVVMALVPRILERVLAGIVGKAKAEGGLRARIVPWALDVGREYAAATQDGKAGGMLPLQYAIAQKLVLSKIKPMMGLDRLDFFVSGSAPLHRDIALTFAGMGVPITEGYGLTETAPVVSSTPFNAIRYGSVGKALADVKIRIAADGEILIKGPNVMLGYYKLPDERPFTDDGWFMTGDIGELDRDGYLFITDRKKELIKTSTGKYVAPGRVEAALKRSIYIGQCFVIGHGRSYPIALVAPNWDLVRREFDIAPETPTETIAARADVRDFLQKEVVEKSADLASFEAIRYIALLPRDLTIENGELSPTMKIKRRVVEAKFAALIETAYAKPVAGKV